MTDSHNRQRDPYEGFEAIVSEYESALLRYAARIVGGPNAAQDVVQNTFLKLFKHWNEGATPSRQLAAWLYRVTHNCAVDFLRKETRRQNLLKSHGEQKRIRHEHDGMPRRVDDLG